MKRVLMFLLLTHIVFGAIDTEDKRRSVSGYTHVPDGSIAGVDKQQYAGYYRGIPAGTPGVKRTRVRDRDIFPITTRRTFRTRSDTIISPGFSQGQITYWDESLRSWVPTEIPPVSPPVPIPDRIAFWDSGEQEVRWLILDDSLQIIDTSLSVSNLSPIVTKAIDYTATTSDFTILADGTTTTVTITLPAAADNSGRTFTIKCINDDNLVDIDPNGSEEIDGDNSNFVLILHETIRIQSDGSNWWIL